MTQILGDIREFYNPTARVVLCSGQNDFASEVFAIKRNSFGFPDRKDNGSFDAQHSLGYEYARGILDCTDNGSLDACGIVDHKDNRSFDAQPYGYAASFEAHYAFGVTFSDFERYNLKPAFVKYKGIDPFDAWKEHGVSFGASLSDSKEYNYKPSFVGCMGKGPFDDKQHDSAFDFGLSDFKDCSFAFLDHNGIGLIKVAAIDNTGPDLNAICPGSIELGSFGPKSPTLFSGGIEVCVL